MATIIISGDASKSEHLFNLIDEYEYRITNKIKVSDTEFNIQFSSGNEAKKALIDLFDIMNSTHIGRVNLSFENNIIKFGKTTVKINYEL